MICAPVMIFVNHVRTFEEPDDALRKARNGKSVTMQRQ